MKRILKKNFTEKLSGTFFAHFFEIIQPFFELLSHVFHDKRSHEAGNRPGKLAIVLPGDFGIGIVPGFEEPVVIGNGSEWFDELQFEMHMSFVERGKGEVTIAHLGSVPFVAVAGL